MGAQWLERNMALFVKHMVTLAANPRSSQTHIDAVYARKCIVFIMSSSVQGMLGEKAQVNAAKELAKVIAKEMEVMSEFYMFEVVWSLIPKQPQICESEDSWGINNDMSGHVILFVLYS